MNLRRTKAVARKEYLHILRDPRSLIAALVMPLLLLLMFSYALSLDVDRIPTHIYDQDKSPQSRELADLFRGSRYFQVLSTADNYASIERGIDQSKILIGLVIPEDYSRNLVAGRDADVQILIDGSDSNTASIALSYGQALVQAYAFGLRSNAQIRKMGASFKSPVEPRIRVLYNNDMKSRNYIVPGLIAVILMIIGLKFALS